MEDRIFLFIDLVGSTATAERIGFLAAHRLLQHFVFDVSDPVLDSGGSIYQYAGDQVLVSWPMARGLRDGDCVACVFAIADAIKEGSDLYERAFGCAPRFRAALHGGRVVVGQVGDWKRELMFVGDTINTAARIEQEYRANDCFFLASAELIARMPLPADVRTRPLGVVQLRGKSESIELVELVHVSAVEGNFALASLPSVEETEQAMCSTNVIARSKSRLRTG